MSEFERTSAPPPPFQDAEETVRAIHHGHVDAVVVLKDQETPQIILLQGADKPYRVLVEHMSDGALTFGMDGTILYVNARVSELTGYAAEDLVGRHVATLFEGNGPPLDADISIEARLSRSDNTSLPVKVWTRAISIDDSTLTTLVTLTDLSVHRRAEQIAAAERFARSVLEQATEAIVVLGPEGRITHASALAEELAEQPPVGCTFSKAFPLEAQSADQARTLARFSAESLDRLLAAKPFHGVEVKLRSKRLANRSFLLSAGPLYDDGKVCVGSIVTLTEITERKRAEEQQAMLVAELNHRVKNILAVVRSVASQTAGSSASMDGFTSAFSGRLKAVALAHDILTATRWIGAGLNELITAVLAPYHSADSRRVTMDGPAILLPADALLPLSMAFHELATNAVKYGALSSQDGRIEITWRSADADRTVELVWLERDGPKVEPGASSGFGMRLIDRVIAYDLDGGSEIDFDPLGLRCTLRFRVRTAPSSDLRAAGSTLR
jgi:PAS domain S-box-containing protein